MELQYNPEVLKELAYWSKKNKIVLKKIEKLLKSIKETPYSGIGKPEALKYNLSGFWSRRINKEHRIIYQVIEDENKVIILSLKGHYE